MSTEARQAQAAYAKEYRRKNRERLNAYRRKWSKDNPDKVKQYQETYWKKKAQEQEGVSG